MTLNINSVNEDTMKRLALLRSNDVAAKNNDLPDGNNDLQNSNEAIHVTISAKKRGKEKMERNSITRKHQLDVQMEGAVTSVGKVSESY